MRYLLIQMETSSPDSPAAPLPFATFIVQPNDQANQLRDIVGLLHAQGLSLGLKSATLITPRFGNGLMYRGKPAIQEERRQLLYDGQSVGFEEQAQYRHFLLNNMTALLVHRQKAALVLITEQATYTVEIRGSGVSYTRAQADADVHNRFQGAQAKFGLPQLENESFIAVLDLIAVAEGSAPGRPDSRRDAEPVLHAEL